MKILVSYRGIPQSPGWATGDFVVKAFRALGHQVFPYAKYYQQNKWVEDRKFNLDDHEFDLILFMECNDGDIQYPELRITRARKTACWLFDTSYYPDKCRGLVNYFGFNYIFLANPLTIQEYKVLDYNNVYYLPYACDRELHGRPLWYPKTRSVALVGSIRDDRIALASKLSEHGVNLELIGDVFREQYIDALASAKIVVNQNPKVGRGLLNMRFFEAMAAGSILVSENDDCGINALSGLHSHAMPYVSIEHLTQTIQKILNSAEYYSVIRSESQQNVFAEHTYDNRCRTLLETVFPHERV